MMLVVSRLSKQTQLLKNFISNCHSIVCFSLTHITPAMSVNFVAFLSVLFIFGTQVTNTMTTQSYLSIILSQWLKPHGMASPALSTFMYQFRKVWKLLKEFYIINSK